MYIRIARQRQGNREYRSLQIAESYRDTDKGGVPRTRILAHLGSLEKLGEKQIEKLISGLQRALGRDASEEKIGELLSARDFGHIYAVCETWNRLGLSPVLDRSADRAADAQAVAIGFREQGHRPSSPNQGGGTPPGRRDDQDTDTDDGRTIDPLSILGCFPSPNVENGNIVVRN
jgi:hypothetical protein